MPGPLDPLDPLAPWPCHSSSCSASSRPGVGLAGGKGGYTTYLELLIVLPGVHRTVGLIIYHKQAENNVCLLFLNKTL